VSEVSEEKPAEDRRTYEELLEELEQLCARLSSSEVGVEEATHLFERALGLQREARQRLDELTERVDRLVRAEADDEVEPSSRRA
jgi:exodeoxyribonuclease VII small subunit